MTDTANSSPGNRHSGNAGTSGTRARPGRNDAVLVLLMALIGAGAFYSGAEWGARQYIHLNSPIEAVMNIRIAHMLRRGDVDAALKAQEYQIHRRVFEHWIYAGTAQRFLWTRDQRKLANAMPRVNQSVLVYLRTYPPPKADAESMAEEYVNQFRQGVVEGVLRMEREQRAE